MARPARQHPQHEESFDQWLTKMKYDYPILNDKNRPWGWRRYEEEWLVSTRENGTYKQSAFHLCRESWKSSNNIGRLDDACRCGEYVPEGVRMVALLLESL